MTAKVARACIVVHGALAVDPRVQREAAALFADNWSLDIICLRDSGDAHQQDLPGARLYRLPVRRHRGSGALAYLLEYAYFFVLATVLLSWLSLWRRYRLVQAHNIPDCLVFAALLPRLRGARVVLDIRDPLPDLYASKFGGSQRHPLVRLARWIERVSIARADHVLTPGEPSRRRIVGRGADPAKVTNVLNSANPLLFPRRLHERESGSGVQGFTLIYHGGLFRRYGVDLAIHAVHQLRDTVPGLRLQIAGYGEEAENLQQLVCRLGLQQQVQFTGWVPAASIAGFAADADLGIVPYRQDSFTDLVYPTKAFEYIAMGIPVIMSGLTGIVELFGEIPDLFFRPADVADMVALVLALYHDRDRLQRLNRATQRAYAPLDWPTQQQQYLQIIRGVTGSASDSRTVNPVASHSR